MRIWISIAFVALAGCGSDQLLGGALGLVAGTQLNNSENTDAGAAGLQGQPGINCWDTNMDGVADPEEDVNDDGAVDVWDCRGTQGEPGQDGAEGPSGPAGADGTDGADGVDGIDGEPGRNGQNGSDGNNGVDGSDGEDGRNGNGPPDDPGNGRGNNGG